VGPGQIPADVGLGRHLSGARALEGEHRLGILALAEGVATQAHVAIDAAEERRGGRDDGEDGEA
jgi:hypothetical protein